MLIRTSTSLQNELGKGKVNTVYALYQGYNFGMKAFPEENMLQKKGIKEESSTRKKMF